jgi:hypothetical protein
MDYWENHPPVVFAYWTLVQVVSGPDWLRLCFTVNNFAPQSCTSLIAHGLDLLISVAAALASDAVARRAGGSFGVAALAAVLVVGFADQAKLSQEGSNPSKLTLLPSSVAVWLYLWSRDARRGWRAAACRSPKSWVASFDGICRRVRSSSTATQRSCTPLLAGHRRRAL